VHVTCDTVNDNDFKSGQVLQKASIQLHNIKMANAESPDPNTDLVPVVNPDEEVDPVAPAPEPKLPTRKDASLKQFLSKMDDYAPIVRILHC